MTRPRRGARPERREIDLAAVRERVARAIAQTEATERLSPERAQAILAERARVLARATEAPEDPGDGLEVVVLSIAGQRHAIAAVVVRQVLRDVDLVPVPGASPQLLGVFNLHGEILPLFDPRPLLGLPAGSERRRVLVLGRGAPELGLEVDGTEEVSWLPRREILPPPDGAGPGRTLLSGVCADGLAILDGEKLLADPRLGAAQR